MWLFASTSRVSSIVVCFTRTGTLLSSTYTFFCASLTIPRAVQMLPSEMTMQPTRNSVHTIITSLILFSRFFITISLLFGGDINHRFVIRLY